VSFAVTNTGLRGGAEVAQLYIAAPADNPVNEPARQLKGFHKVDLNAGETKHVTISIDARAVSYWNTATHSWTPEPGCHEVLVGSSERDIKLRGTGVNQDLSACGPGVSIAANVGAGGPLPNTSAAGLPAGTYLDLAVVVGLALLLPLVFGLAAGGERRVRSSHNGRGPSIQPARENRRRS
jgi:beta-glucosidase